MFSSNASQVSNDVNYIEDVFSTYLYAGNGATQTITNGIDLAGKGGLVWIKSRSAVVNHTLWDTSRGVRNYLSSNNTDANTDFSGTSYGLSAFNANGFALGLSANGENSNGSSLCSWTFREQPKFFDVVTYTGDGTARNIAHSLGSAPGCIIIKRTDVAGEWRVWHRGLATPNTQLLYLNRTDAVAATTVWSTTSPTATEFSLTDASSTNANGGTFVAYLFAHDAGGFGLSGNENVVSCGSLTASALTTVTLGYEPQWVMVKKSSGTGDWYMLDVMRGMSQTTGFILEANKSDADFNAGQMIVPTATGFQFNGVNFGSTSGTFIYIAIRRGPMKVPTLGTKVYNAIARTGTNTATAITGVGFSPDFVTSLPRNAAGNDNMMVDRLRGRSQGLRPFSTNAESVSSSTQDLTSFDMDGVSVGTGFHFSININGVQSINYFFRRAPSFFDEVCYTGTGVAGFTVNHNLTVAPELIIIKRRDVAGDDWDVSTFLGATTYYRLYLNTNGAIQTGAPRPYGLSGVPLYSKPTATQLQFGANYYVNAASTYVAYLFATCAGVSKVGSYTGTGATQAIACGFTAGARFVMIKRTDAAGDWYVWDSARGIVAGNDPHLSLNSTAAEVTGTDYIDPSSAGFQISSTAPAEINASGGSYIFLAVA